MYNVLFGTLRLISVFFSHSKYVCILFFLIIECDFLYYFLKIKDIEKEKKNGLFAFLMLHQICYLMWFWFTVHPLFSV